MRATRTRWRRAAGAAGLATWMISGAALAQEADPAPASTILIDTDDDGLSDARDACPTDPRNRCKEEPKWPERPNSSALMVAGFVTMGIGGTLCSIATFAANFCLWCNRGASEAQEEKFYPYAAAAGALLVIGAPIAAAGSYRVPDKSGPKDRKYEAGIPAPTLIVGPGTATVRWSF